jgi:DNA-binding CsgD family transcriptional regulator
MVANREHLPALYGRQAECEALAELVDGARHGTSSVLVLRGEAGTGKTVLAGYAAGLARDLRVVQATGTESETGLEYAGLHQLCGGVLGLLDRLPVPQCTALEVVFGLRAGPAPDRLMVSMALLRLLGEAAAERPLVCVIDDAQWLDRASRQAVAFAARRLPAESTLVIFTLREPHQDLAGLPEMVLGGLPDADARHLLGSVVRWPLDERVREQVLTETRGNPRALVELLRGLPPARLAGGFGLPGALVPGIPGSLPDQLRALPAQGRLLLLAAAAEPTGDPALLQRAARRLGIAAEAELPVAETGLVTLGTRVVFADPVVRSAIYHSAPVHDRRAAHHALAQAVHPQAEPDRRAWHQSQALGEPEEEAAAELERTAARAEARGGLAARAAFLERAALLTPQPARRSARTLDAAAVMLTAGEAGNAAKLLDLAEAGILDDHRHARAVLLRARLAFAVSHGGQAPRLLADAAGALAGFDAAEARAALLEAIGAAMFAAGLAVPGGTAADIARAARQLPPAGLPGAPGLLLDGLAAYFTDGETAGTPLLRRALPGFAGGLTAAEELRWLPLACAAALLAWDDQAWETLSGRRARLARETGALSDLPLALNSLACLHLLAGDLGSGEALANEAQVISHAVQGRGTPYAALGLAAVRGRQDPALALIDGAARDSAARGEGLGLAAAKWAAAVLFNGTSQYADALSAAEEAVEYAGSSTLAGWAMAELVEAAARTEQPRRAVAAMRYLSQVASAAGTDWVLGLRSRSLALLSDGAAADDLYRAALKHLGQSRARVDLARAHLLYGEWLRRENRRVDAREQLRLAHEMLSSMGAEGFAERARRELLATGKSVRKRTMPAPTGLTAQELQIATRAGDGQTNTEIGTELFLSARTVEWHLRKVFAKLAITSRRQLRHALPAAAGPAGSPAGPGPAGLAVPRPSVAGDLTAVDVQDHAGDVRR